MHFPLDLDYIAAGQCVFRRSRDKMLGLVVGGCHMIDLEHAAVLDFCAKSGGSLDGVILLRSGSGSE